MVSKRPVIVDCDPGNDDALAILMVAAAPNIKLVALSTVAGNLPPSRTAKNALLLADWLGLKVPVTSGSYPLLRKYKPLDPSIMGAAGLGSSHLPESSRQLDPRTSVELLYDYAKTYAGELEILATGPLSNIALLLMEHPDACKLIRQIVFMGGSIDGGNTSPVAEFNIHEDAEAARIVFHSGIPLTMVGLDVCYKNRMKAEDFRLLMKEGGRIGNFVGELFFYPGTIDKPFPSYGIPVFDSLAAAVIIDSDCATYKFLHVDIETTGEFTYGETVVDIKNRLGLDANTNVVMSCDRKRYLELVLQAVHCFK
jgi:inosine-uridine nucleoside N-ribohydrolase